MRSFCILESAGLHRRLISPAPLPFLATSDVSRLYGFIGLSTFTPDPMFVGSLAEVVRRGRIQSEILVSSQSSLRIEPGMAIDSRSMHSALGWPLDLNLSILRLFASCHPRPQAVYPSVLSVSRVSAHYMAATTPPPPPVLKRLSFFLAAETFLVRDGTAFPSVPPK